MKAVSLLALVAVAVALRPGTALRCYSCQAWTSGQDCQHVQNCTGAETQCRTERIRAIGVLRVVSKGCSSHCVEGWQDYYLGRKNVTCCATDLCNASAPRAPGSLGLLAALGLLLGGPGVL
ncbi:prostate stem cell antigen [Dasypus novemcinctus]|uniref:prostate stem cell antigen n=1 Tax=Dasypus novemcinctus TaxID=9361 RepID=UPI0026601A5C|nr:prostate stem cell antigen [Dasypus novemcinctus]